MKREEIESQLRVKCLELEYDVLRVVGLPDSDSIFALLFDGMSAKELYVNPYLRYASLQTLSSVSILEPLEVSHWFNFD